MRCLALVLVAALALRAQERQPAFLNVIDANGKPVAAAKVTCFASPPVPVEGDSDVLDVESDERGRAVVKLLADRIYSAFAVTRASDASPQCSETAEYVIAGGEHALRIVRECPSKPFVFEGVDAWRDHGPLAVRVFPVARNVLLLPLVDGRMPPIPDFGGAVVTDAKGEVLYMLRGSGRLRVALPGMPEPAEVRLALPPPQPLPVRVRDTEGKPLANAELWCVFDLQDAGFEAYWDEPRARPRYRYLGRTGEDGNCRVELAVPVHGGMVTQTVLIEARLEGRAIGRGCFWQTAYDGRRQVAVADGVLPITLAPRAPVRVDPPTPCELTVLGRFQNPPAADEGPVAGTCGADGIGSMALAPEFTARRIARLQRGTEPPIWTALEIEPNRYVASAAARTVQVHVVDENGNPARGRCVTFMPWLQCGESPGLSLPVPVDRTGTARLRVGRGEWLVWTADARGCAWRLLDEAGPDADVRLELKPMDRYSFRLLDADRKPRVGYAVTLAPHFNWDGRTLGRTNLYLGRVQAAMQRAHMRTHVTDEAGCVHFTMLPLPGAKLGLRWSIGLAPGQVKTYEGVAEPGECVDIVVD